MVGTVIKEMREARGWTQHDLAERANMKQPSIARLESTGRAGMQTLQKVAGALGVTVFDILHAAEAQRNEPDAQLAELAGIWPALSTQKRRLLVKFAYVMVEDTVLIT